MKKIFLLVTLYLLAFVLCKGNEEPDFKDKVAADEEQTGTGDGGAVTEGIPVMGSRTVFNVNVEELSGLCLNADGTALLSCGDQGVVKEISFDGKVSNLWEHDADMEGITIHPETKDIYIAIEGAQKLYKLDAPDYKNYSSIFYVQEAVNDGYDNSGLEGIDYYKDDIVFIGSQWGANLWQYKLDGTKVSKISLSDFASEVAGLCYDPVEDWLWVVDSNRAKLYVCTVKGKLVTSYDLAGVENAESVCVDRERGCVWVGSDEGSPKLYRYSFTF